MLYSYMLSCSRSYIHLSSNSPVSAAIIGYAFQFEGACIQDGHSYVTESTSLTVKAQFDTSLVYTCSGKVGKCIGQLRVKDMQLPFQSVCKFVVTLGLPVVVVSAPIKAFSLNLFAFVLQECHGLGYHKFKIKLNPQHSCMRRATSSQKWPLMAISDQPFSFYS